MITSAIQVVTLAKIKCVFYYFSFQSAKWPFKMSLLAISFFGCLEIYQNIWEVLVWRLTYWSLLDINEIHHKLNYIEITK